MTDIKQNPMFQMGEKLFEISDAIMARHKGIERVVSEKAKGLTTATLREKWDKNGAEAREALEIGRDYGKKIVGEMVRLDGGGDGEDEGGNAELIFPPAEVVAKVEKQAEVFKSGDGPGVVRHWNALIRQLERTDTDYKL